MGFQFSGGGGSKFPSWTAPFTRFAFQGDEPQGPGNAPTSGLIGDAWAGSQAAPGAQLFAGLMNQLGNAQGAGSDIRALGAQATQQGFGNLLNLAQQGMQGGQASGWLQSLIPQLFGSATDMAGRINQGAAGFQQGLQGAGQGLSSANQVLQDTMNPTAQNALFQNAWENQVRPEVAASFAARGLGTSGPAIQGEMEASRDLSNQFAMRQRQEQLGALQAQQGAIGQFSPLAGGLGQLGVAGAQVPGAVFNQFQQGIGAGQNALQGAANLQGQPGALVGQGADLFRQGLNLPLEYQQALYNFTRLPQLQLLGGISGTQLSGTKPSFGKG